VLPLAVELLNQLIVRDKEGKSVVKPAAMLEMAQPLHRKQYASPP